MNVTSLNLHTARRVRAQRHCINGTWQLQITVDLEDDSVTTFTIYAETRDALDVAWSADEYVRLTSSETEMETSVEPFDMLAELKERLPSSGSGETR